MKVVDVAVAEILEQAHGLSGKRSRRTAAVDDDCLAVVGQFNGRARLQFAHGNVDRARDVSVCVGFP